MKKIFLIFFIAFSVIKSTTNSTISDQKLESDSFDLIRQDQDLMESINKARDQSELDKKQKNNVKANENQYINPVISEKVQEAFRNNNLSPLGKDQDQYNRVNANVLSQINQYITTDNVKVWFKRRFGNIKGLSDVGLRFGGPVLMFHQLNEMRTSGKKEKERSEKAEKSQKELNEKLSKIDKQNEKIIKNQKDLLQKDSAEAESGKQELITEKNKALNAADAEEEKNYLRKGSDYNSDAAPHEEDEFIE